MMQTSTAMRSAASGCGCGCGGSPRHVTGAFVRPRFFAGMLLTEDDLQALTGYITGKSRLHNRLLLGPGVVCGLEVTCDPCGGGTVTVRPGYALDCCGNDIVVGCPETVDVEALIHDMRVRSLGAEHADCGDPCGGADREFGLYVRYVEEGIDPIAPYPTDESCPPTGCFPSRIRETFRFLVKCVEEGDHRYDPAARLAARLGTPEDLDPIRAAGRRLGRYAAPMRRALQVAGRTIRFDDADATRFREGRDALAALPEQPSVADTRRLTEQVRRLAGALARYDSYDDAGRDRLRRDHNLGDVDGVRATLPRAVEVLGNAVDAAWTDERDRVLARAVLSEARDRVVRPDPGAALEKAMLAQGAPLSYDLRADLVDDLRLLRGWLLARLDKSADLTDCSLRSTVSGVDLPPALPATPPEGGAPVSPGELSRTGLAADELSRALLRYVADVVCASLRPPCSDCTDTDVLLARLEVDDCTVVRICAADREQWLPGGPGYAAWAPKLYEARALAQRVCCAPQLAPPPGEEPGEGTGPVGLAFLPRLIGAGTPSDLDSLLELLFPAGGNGATAAAGPVWEHIAGLRAQVGQLTEVVAALRAQAGRGDQAGPPAGPAGPAEEAESAAAAEPVDEAAPAEPPRRAPAKKAPAQESTRGAAEPDRSRPGRRPRGSRSGSQES